MSTVSDKNPPTGTAILSLSFTGGQSEQILLRRLFWFCLLFMALPTLAAGQTIHTIVGDTDGTLKSPSGVFVTPERTIYIADRDNHRIALLDSFGLVTTVAGDGTPGYNGDNGPATSAQLHSPTGVFVDKNGSLYIADRDNHRIRKVTSGNITTIAGTDSAGFSGDGRTATSSALHSPTGVFVDKNGSLYIADRDNHRIRKVTGNTLTTVAGNGTPGYSGDNGPATSAQLQSPTGVFVDKNNSLYIADRDNHRIRKVTGNIITTVAGNGTPGYFGDGGKARDASLAYPTSIWVDTTGNLLIADRFNQRIRRVTPDSTITTLAGNGQFGFSGDGGAPSQASLKNPTGVAADSAGQVYIADTGNNRIRYVHYIPLLQVSTPATGLSGVTTVGPGAEVPIFKVGIRGDGTNTVNAISLSLTDLSKSTGFTAGDLTALKLYRSTNAQIDRTDPLLVTRTSVRLDTLNVFTFPLPDQPPVQEERFYLISALLDTIIQEGRAFRVGFPEGGILTSRGRMGTGFAVNDSHRVALDVVATRLLFTRQPGGSISDVALAAQPELTVLDGYGNLDTSFADIITLTAKDPDDPDGTPLDRLQNNTAVPDSGFIAFTNLIYSAQDDDEEFYLEADDLPGGVEGDLTPEPSRTLRSNIVNDPPRLEVPSEIMNEDDQIRFSVTELVDDPDDTLFTWAFTSEHIQGQADGDSIILRPEQDWFGTDTLLVTVTDAHGASASAQAIFQVRSVNDAPRIFLPEQLTIYEDDILSVPLRQYVEDPDSPFAELAWEFTPSPGLFYQRASTDTLTVWAAPDSFGQYRMSLRVQDIHKAAASDTFQVIVLPVNDPPILAIPDTSLPQRTSLSLFLPSFVHDPDDPPATLAWSGTGDARIPVSVDSSGRAVIRPDSTWYGTARAIFTATDTAGAMGVDTVRIEVRRVNLPPVLFPLPDTSLAKGDTLVMDLRSYAADPDDSTAALAWQVSGARQGKASFSGSALTYISSRLPARTDTLTVRVRDPLGRAATDTLRVTITNQAPRLRALPDLELRPDSTALLSLDLYIEDDSPLDELTWQVEPDSGLMAILRSDIRQLSLQPLSGWSGQRRTVVRATDFEGATDTDTFLVTVANQAPLLASLPDTSIGKGDTLSIDLNSRVVDPDDTAQTLSWQVSENPRGQATLVGGTLTYVSSRLPAHVDTLQLQVTDAGGLSASGSMRIQVVNQPPILRSLPDMELARDRADSLRLDSYVQEDGPLEDLVWSAHSEEGLLAQVSPSRILVIRSLQDGSGKIQVIVQVADPEGASATDSLQVTVRPDTSGGDGDFRLLPLPHLSVEVGESVSPLDLDDYLEALSPQSGALTWETAGGRHAAFTLLPGNLLQLTGVSPGTDTLTVTARSSQGTVRSIATTVSVSGTASIPDSAADFDGDGVVGFDDFFRFADRFNTASGGADWDPLFDLDKNGAVDFDDFFLFADRFGRGTVQEPVRLGDIPDLTLQQGTTLTLSLDDYLLAGLPTQISWSATAATIVRTVIAPATHRVTLEGLQAGQEELRFTATDLAGNAASDGVLITVREPAAASFGLDLPAEITVRRGRSAVLPLDSYVVQASFPVEQLTWSASATVGIQVAIRDRTAFIAADADAPGSGQVSFTARSPEGEEAIGIVRVTVR